MFRGPDCRPFHVSKLVTSALPEAARAETHDASSGVVNAIPGWYHLFMAMTLRLTPDDEHALALLAEADGVSKQEATVRAIHEAASRRLRQDKIRTLSAGARERYADLLDRLGQ